MDAMTLEEKYNRRETILYRCFVASVPLFIGLGIMIGWSTARCACDPCKCRACCIK